jgi:uncharacterized protein
MKFKFIDQKIKYDGAQLKPLYAYTQHKVTGDSIISFIGECDVSLEHMVDAEDFVVNAKIQAQSMLHFIIEVFNQNIFTAVSLQRLLVSIAQNLLLEKNLKLSRKGDDLYLGAKKLSVSIASVSTVSAMIHLGLNITNEGTPVETCALNDFGIDTKHFSLELMQHFSNEFDSIFEATQKVKPLV